MADTIRILVTLAEHADARLVEQALEGDSSLEVVGYAEHLDDWRQFLEQPGDVVVVGCYGHDDGVAAMVDHAVKHRPDRPVVVMSEASPNGFLRQAFEAGADDVITLPQSPEQVAFTLQKVIARRKGLAMPGKAAAPIIAVLGPKGGTGKTLIATNLAVALAQRDANVVLVDLDLQFGDIGLALGLSPERTMYDLMKAGPPFDHEKLDRHLIRHSSGVKVLIAPTRPDQASAVSIDFLRDVYASLRTMCDAVIVDTPPGFTPEVIATIDVSRRGLHGRDARLALAQEHEARPRDARSDGLRHRARLARPQPRRLAGRDHPGRRLDDRRAAAGRVHPERPRDPALDQRGNADRRGEAAVRGGEGVPRPRRPLREDAGSEAGAAAELARRASGR